MKKILFILFTIHCSLFTALARETQPIQGTVISAANQYIQYTGRISFTNPEHPAWNYPGTQIIAAFEGTSLKMIAKPGSGYYMAQIDQAEPFKVSFMEKRDSVVTLATALPDGRHTVRLMYVIEGYEMYPEFWGFVLDKGKSLVEAPANPTKVSTMPPRTTTIAMPRSRPAPSVPSTGWWPVAASVPIVTMARPRQVPRARACLYNMNIRVMPGI